LDVYQAARWARATALRGQPVFLDCFTFRLGLYSSHFGEVRPGIENELAEWTDRDPLKRMADWLIEHGVASAEDLERMQQEEAIRLDETFKEVLVERREG
jgi:TPP-dependent pyruvate/acetoin dehydrogenase alpha subunit